MSKFDSNIKYKDVLKMWRRRNRIKQKEKGTLSIQVSYDEVDLALPHLTKELKEKVRELIKKGQLIGLCPKHMISALRKPATDNILRELDSL